MANDDGYGDVRDVRDLFKLKSTKSVYRLVRSDPSFPVVKIGGVWRFPMARVRKWAADRTQGAAR